MTKQAARRTIGIGCSVLMIIAGAFATSAFAQSRRYNGGITVFSRDGRTEHIAVPDPMVTNLCFGGPDMRDVWITGSGTGRLFKCRWPRPGPRHRPRHCPR